MDGKGIDAFIEKIGLPVCLVDKNFRIYKVNAPFFTILKSDKREILDKRIDEIFPSLSLQKKLPQEVEAKVGRRTFLLTAVKGEDNFWIFLIDITKRKTEEEKLKENLALFTAITETALVGTFVMEKGKIIYANDSLGEIFGCKKENIIGKDLFEFVYEEDSELVRKKLKEAERKKGISFVFRGAKKNRKVISLRIFLYLIHEEAPKIVGTIMDITEEVKAREKIRRTHEQLNRIYEATINAFGKTIEARDPYTAGHQLRVAEISCLLGKEMGLSEKKLKILRISAAVHDIGKIAVPSEILTKPGKLTDAEFELVKRHPVVGYQILKTIPFNAPVAKIVLQHHEKMDGSGYPQRLKDGQILMEARILAVADTFEAMLSYRPYRPAHSLKEVIKELERGKGKKYDKEVVSSLFRILRQGLLTPYIDRKTT